ncbi:hypothetical protein [Mycolicibacterium sphagni]|uniref:Uncharacterized protein n=1 Tax=Mycolicibacterium sphagni TaxID=1786 RepID=A0A255DGA1_9MYCO|nr:hypothetical protein [Mycolicibacterium sphagni]OYN77671.1 hypothetical protein CG716_17405 [Mycolicibacterium sphagni]
MDSYIRFILYGRKTPEGTQSAGSYLDRVRIAVLNGDTLPQDAPSFLDTIAAWLIFGDAVEACKTFDSYLIIVICLIADWTDRQHAVGDGQALDTSGAWVYQATEDHESAANDNGDLEKEYRERWPEQPEVRIFSDQMPMCRLDYHTWLHPALSRTTWELAVAGRIDIYQ